ncbi:MAG: hypothetical protein AABY09_02395, partial [Nanoarchaeota archaeon]
MKKIILLLILLIAVSGCVKQAEEISEENGLPAEQKVQLIVKTQIKVSATGMEMIISPSKDNVVKGIITITVTKAPTDTGMVAFAIIGPGIESIEKTGPNLGFDGDGSDGWSFEFDTNTYPNNIYSIATIAFPSITPGGGAPPLGALQAKIEIRNEEFSPVESPLITAPYKIMSGSCKNPLKSIEEAKRAHATAIGVNIISGSTNEEDGAAIWEPPRKAARGCAKLIALAHENSFGTVLTTGLANEE